MRSIWKGQIQFSLVNIPVRVYAAVDTGKQIHFDWLTENDHHQVGYVKTDKETGEPLEQEDIVKGYEYESGQYVIVDEEDLEKVKPKSSQVVELKGFINKDDVHPALYDKPYFLGPEDESAMNTYRLFTETLKKTDKVAIGTVVLRKKESPVMLTSYEGGIVMYKLRYPEAVRSMEDVPNVEVEEEVDEEQLEMAEELVNKMTKDFAEIELKDKYYHAMQNMIEDKIEGREIVSSQEAETPEVGDLSKALKESLESSGNGRSNGRQKYENLTKDELYKKAQKADIEGRSDMDKGELIKALRS